MPTITNQFFYDLNESRRYCVDGDADFPSEIISDLKVSVPYDTEDVSITGLYLSGNSIRLTITAFINAQDTLVASFSSDLRATLQTWVPLPLVSHKEGFGGSVVFGYGIRTDYTEKKIFRVSEECLTRYIPSRINAAGKTCHPDRISGEVTISCGDPEIARTQSMEINPDASIINSRVMCVHLVDNLQMSTENPLVNMANGSNSYFGEGGRVSPIYRIFGAVPNDRGEVRIALDKHFSAASVVDNLYQTNPVISKVALGTDLTMVDVCGQSEDQFPPMDPSDPACPVTAIEFEVIDYE